MSNFVPIVKFSDIIDDKVLFSELEKFDVSIGEAVRISDRCLGFEHTGRQNRALYVFAKLIMHSYTLSDIIHRFLDSELGKWHLDHFSIATISRSIIDASLMTKYISAENLSNHQWNLRRHVMFLHDLTNRKRFITAMGKAYSVEDQQFLASYPAAKQNLLEKIETYGQISGLKAVRIEELKKGQTVFLDGSRGAAREAGWNLDLFEFHQSYMSAYVHSHPVSFMRAAEHAIDFQKPSRFQLGFYVMVLEFSRNYLSDATFRMDKFTGSISKDPLGHIE